jgi:predicted N-acetyltransferase YhbS
MKPLTQIRPLNLSDIPACLDLAANRQWSREPEKWRFLLTSGKGYGIDAPNGGLAATATLVRFGDEISVIGMVLVRDSLEGRGLGRRMMEFMLQRTKSLTVFLYATEQGRILYEKLGFESRETLIRHVGTFTANAISEGFALTRPMQAADFEEVVRLDREAFGTERTPILKALQEQGMVQRRQVVERAGKIVGYGFSWQNVNIIHLGPIVASDDEAAQALISELAADQRLPVRIDLPARFERLNDWVSTCKLVASPPVPLMVLDGRSLPGQRERLYSIIMQATG